MVLVQYEPIEKYRQFKRNIDIINENINKLNFIKDSLVIFHKNKYIKVIQDIENITNSIENKSIFEFRTEKMHKKIDNLLKYKFLCYEINKLKDSLLLK